ncbi:hypothetical protein IFM89_031857 [Coptis chinensis]|uniref:Uncharacterized protein n=1 Tax=Coptis chinensis TaxID=261450 RepID=A0A835H235_9MAGN|nr:hypothetical protein IFM89_031857 [Coptis chinensis]
MLWWKFCRWLMIGSEKKLVKAWKIFDRHLEQYIMLKKDNLRKGDREINMIASYMISQETGNSGLLPEGNGFLIDIRLSFLFAGRDTSGTWLGSFG